MNQTKNDPNAPLNSIHTNTFPNLLKQTGISLVVSTYQAGKLIVVRADRDKLNTHFRVFNKPMGLAATREKIALGTAAKIIEFRNVPATGQKLNPPGLHDACFLPRNIHITGDIDIHEMTWVEDDLWFINTRFSCLCTLDNKYSFVPRWRPPFISQYDLRDRCHLNGLAAKDGKPKYVTALGNTDTPAGWRANKASGGILMDIDTNEFILTGLSMPHSPRWYRDKLWVLESGKGSLSVVDTEKGETTTVTQLPGFTRGLDFWGDFAFIGLSQVRETAVFSGIPLTKTQTERICGVWVVNIVSGETVAFLRFTEAIQEIFAVSVLPGIRFPEIVDYNDGLLANSYVLPNEALAEVVQPSQDWEFAQTHLDRGNKLYGKGSLEEAIKSYRRCLEIQADFLPARYNLGVTLGDLDRFEEAIIELNQVIDAEASHADAYNSLGYVYSQLDRLDDAIDRYEKAIKIRPKFPKAHHNLGMILLKKGEFKRGWQECEWRWQTDTFTPLKCPHPRWQGEEIDGTLLIHTEQGAGDAIQFSRFIPLAAKRCKKVIVVCTANLKPLFANIPEIAEIYEAGEISEKAFDTYIAIMSLPLVLDIDLNNLPAEVPYLKTTKKSRYDFPAGETNIGIVWAGSPTFGNDRFRSCHLKDFLPILQVPNINFYSLQKGEKSKQLESLPEEINITDLSDYIEDYGDTAAIIDRLDLVISVDTSVAHLTGALGKPIWTLLGYNADWRWLLNRNDSPWYPTMRLFRQKKHREWPEVFERVIAELEKSFSDRPNIVKKQRRIVKIQNKPAVDSFAVIVPAYNVISNQGEEVLLNTLNSIDRSIAVFQKEYPNANKVGIEVILVDDGSSDTTPEVLEREAKNRQFFRSVNHSTNKGQSAARNTGVKESNGGAIFFCDADDLYLKNHILQSFAILNQTAPPKAKETVSNFNGYPAAVKTKIKFADSIHPEWKKRVEFVHTLNLCLRREAHEFIQGFPEDNAFRECSYSNEDWAYSVWLHQFFQILLINKETVEYIRYPGNHLDRQLLRFQQAPGQYQEAITESDRQLLVEIESIIKKRSNLLKTMVNC